MTENNKAILEAANAAIAEGDKVMVRCLWRGTDSSTGKKMEFKGFVLGD